MRTAAETAVRVGLATLLVAAIAAAEETRALARAGDGELARASATVLAIVATLPPIALIALLCVLAGRRVRRPLSAIAAVLIAVGCAVANQSLYPRLYPRLHGVLAVTLIAATVIVADGLAIALGPRKRLRRTAGLGIALSVIAVLLAPGAARTLAASERTRLLLHENSELLRPLARGTTRHAPLIEDSLAPDPLAVRLDGPRLDAAGRDVLLITVDALRADHIGTYGYSRPTTPHLDALAEQAVVFGYAYTSAPQTPYALSSIMTGTHVRALLDAHGNETLRTRETWAERLERLGYRTAAFYPETIFYTDRRRFTAMAERHLGFSTATVDHSSADARVAKVLAFVDSLPAGAPFFAWAHLFEPHEPYEQREEFAFGDDDIDRYDAEIALTDRAIDTLVRGIRARRPQAIVIVTADHGEAFGEHGARYHGTTLYEEQVRVPLIVSAPGLIPAARIEEPVQTIDLLPTVANALGAGSSPDVRGRDLAPWLVSGRAPPGLGVAHASLAGSALLAIGSRRLICEEAIASCAVFDLASDPLQRSPILAAEHVTAMRSPLGAVVTANRH